jgi:NADPH-dependent ferric siderophore reductase
MDTMTLKESASQLAAVAARRVRQWSLRIVAVRQMRPRMRRIQLTGADLGDFKPNAGQELIVLIPAPANETLRRH